MSKKSGLGQKFEAAKANGGRPTLVIIKLSGR